jgi:hypothetical protein
MKNSVIGIFEIHEIGQSLHNYYLDQRKFELILPKKAYGKKFGKQVVTKNLKTSKTNCHEENSNNMMNCINNFCAKKLGCTLPWVQKSGAKCTGKEKFEEFKNLSAKLKGERIGNELMEEGCPIPDCHQRAWTIDFTENFDNEKGRNESSSEIELTFPHYTPVLVRNEIKLYTFSSWIADIGGFMGLLLGESLVSYVLLGTHWMTKLTIQK